MAFYSAKFCPQSIRCWRKFDMKIEFYWNINTPFSPMTSGSSRRCREREGKDACWARGRGRRAWNRRGSGKSASCQPLLMFRMLLMKRRETKQQLIWWHDLARSAWLSLRLLPSWTLAPGWGVAVVHQKSSAHQTKLEEHLTIQLSLAGVWLGCIDWGL